MLEKRAVQTPIVGRRDDVAPLYAPMGTLASAVNVEITRAGEVVKRAGTASMSTGIVGGGSVTTGRMIHGVNNQVLLRDGRRVYSRAGSSWRLIGDDVMATHEFDLMPTQVNMVVCAAATNGVVDVVVIYRPGVITALYAIRDVATGTWLVPPTEAPAPVSWVYRASVFYVANRFVVVVGGMFFAIDETTFAVTGPAYPTAHNERYDILLDPSDNTIIVAWLTDTTVNIARVQPSTLTLIGSVSTLAIPLGDAEALPSIALHNMANGRIYIASRHTTHGVRGITVVKSTLAHESTTTYDTTALARDPATQVVAGMYVSTPAHPVWWYNVPRTTGWPVRDVRCTTSSPSWLNWTADARVCGQAFEFNGERYVPMLLRRGNDSGGFPGVYDSSVVFCTSATPEVRAVIARGLATAASDNHFFRGGAHGARMVFPVYCIADPGPLGVFGPFMNGVAALRADDPDASGPVVANGVTVLPGSAPRMVTASNTRSLPFMAPPRVTTAIVAGSSTPGTYLLAYTFVFFDHVGNTYESAVVRRSVTVNSAQSVSVEIAMPREHAVGLSENMRIRRCISAPAGAVPNYSGGNVFEGALLTVTVSPDGSGSGIPIYTTGGVLDNYGPEPCKGATAWDNRIWLYGLEERNALAFSKELREGFGVAFNPGFRVYCGDQSVRIVSAVATEYGLLVIARRGIFLVRGTGPDDTGRGGYDEPVTISTDVGALNGRGVVTTRVGVFFVSSRGVFVVRDGRNVEFVGSPVLGASAANVVGAIDVPDKGQVRFYASDGTVLVYHYDFGQWTTFTVQPPVHAAMVDGVPSYLRANGVVVREAAGSWDDDGAAIISTVTTHPMSPAGVHGDMRAYELHVSGQAMSAHALNVAATLLNGAGSSIATTESRALSVAPSVSGEPLRVALKLAGQRATSVQVSISDSYGTPGQGFRLQSLGLVFGVRASAAKVTRRAV